MLYQVLLASRVVQVLESRINVLWYIYNLENVLNVRLLATGTVGFVDFCALNAYMSTGFARRLVLTTGSPDVISFRCHDDAVNH